MDFTSILKESFSKFMAEIIHLVIFFLLGAILCLTIVLIPTVMGGFMRGFLGYVREGKKPELNELWTFTSYLQIVLLCIIAGLLTMIGYLLLIIPGVILTVWWMYAVLFIVDKNMGFWEAMGASRNAVGRHGFMNNFVIILIIGVLNALGSALAGFATLLTGPYGMLVLAMAYIASTAEQK